MSNESAGVPHQWYTQTFDELYSVVYAHRSTEAAKAEAAFAVQGTRLGARERVLDLCCGNGRHMLHLLRHTPHVVGLDYSPTLLAAANNAAPLARLVRADMRALPFQDVFDVVVNFFTSFGYFVSDEENLAVVRNIARALRERGRFLIDHINKANAEQTLVPHSQRIHDPYAIVEDRWMDQRSQRINKRATVIRDEVEIAVLHESVQLYDPDEFGDLLRAGGLEVERLFGDFSGVALGPAEPRMIAVGHRA